MTQQTVLCRLGGKAGLVEAAWAKSFREVRSERDHVEPGDVAGAVRALVGHYERIGERVLRMLAEEHANAGLRAIADHGRAYHAEWCERIFGPLTGAARERRLAQLVTVTDVYAWKLLRRDRGLSRPQTELAMRELLEPLTGGTR